VVKSRVEGGTRTLKKKNLRVADYVCCAKVFLFGFSLTWTKNIAINIAL